MKCRNGYRQVLLAHLVSTLPIDVNEADDALQDFYLNAWERTVDLFDPLLASFLWWVKLRLRQHAGRLTARIRRKYPTGGRMNEVLQDVVASGELDPFAQSLKREKSEQHRREINDALFALLKKSPDQAVAVVLRDVVGLSPSEGASLLGVKYRAFNTRACRGHTFLREYRAADTKGD